MAPDEYSSTGGGGKLKLKGGKVSDGRVEKRKKKKGLKKEKEDSSNQTRSQDQEVAERGPEGTDQEKTPAVEDERDEMPEGSAAKTEAERKYEEVRRKRVCSFVLFSLLLHVSCCRGVWGLGFGQS